MLHGNALSQAFSQGLVTPGKSLCNTKENELRKKYITDDKAVKRYEQARLVPFIIRL